MSTPKHRTAPGSTYFVTTKCWQGRCVFQVPGISQILVETLFHYRGESAYLLHEFVLMPNHVHLLMTPGAKTSLEKAIQLIKGGSSHRIHEETNRATIIWQKGFYDWTIRDANDWNAKVEYIRMNPVRAELVAEPRDWPYSSASGRFVMDPAPRRYLESASGAKAQVTSMQAAGLKPRPPEKTANDTIAAAGSSRPCEELSSGAEALTAQTRTLGPKHQPPEENAHDGSIAGRSDESHICRENRG